jgi:hypothetical protein
MCQSERERRRRQRERVCVCVREGGKESLRGLIANNILEDLAGIGFGV